MYPRGSSLQGAVTASSNHFWVQQGCIARAPSLVGGLVRVLITLRDRDFGLHVNVFSIEMVGKYRANVLVWLEMR